MLCLTRSVINCLDDASRILTPRENIVRTSIGKSTCLSPQYSLAVSVAGKHVYDDSNKPKKLEFGVHAVMNHLLHVSLRSLFSRSPCRAHLCSFDSAVGHHMTNVSVSPNSCPWCGVRWIGLSWSRITRLKRFDSPFSDWKNKYAGCHRLLERKK